MHRSGYYRLERQLPGGIRTRKESAPFHGARKKSSTFFPDLLIFFLFLDGRISLDLLGLFVVIPLLGASSAAGSLALARRADDRELLEHGADVADTGLTEEEKSQRPSAREGERLPRPSNF